MTSPQLQHASSASARAEAALEFLAGCRAHEPLLMLLPQLDVARSWLAGRATFGWERATPAGLAARLAAPELARRAQVPIGNAAAEAVAARVIAHMRSDAVLGALESVAEAPTLARALANTLLELRLESLAPAQGLSAELTRAAALYAEELERSGLADRALVFAHAREAIARGEVVVGIAAIGAPLLVFDTALESRAEAAFVAALVERSSLARVVVPSGDAQARERLADLIAAQWQPIALSDGVDPALARMQESLFDGGAAAPTQQAGALGALGAAGAPSPAVRIRSAPGENREAVEIAREILAEAEAGRAFDRMAVLVRSPENYRAHIEEAFARAGIPFWLARGARRPDPDGRAFLALLACAAEGLSAARFAEYLSLGVLPDATPAGEPPAALEREDRWVPPDAEMLGGGLVEALEEEQAKAQREAAALRSVDPEAALPPVLAGTLRAPRRFEKLIVDAAVIGGAERWKRRLEGLEYELERGIDELDGDDPRALGLARDRDDLAALQSFGLPLIEVLDALPVRASWGEWIDALSALATRALRHPARVLSVLAEFAPMAGVGELGLAELQLVLAPRLREVPVPPTRDRYGSVFVGSCDAARGLSFDLVFVPGLAEKLFPRKIVEDPLLLDAQRRALLVHGLRLPTNDDRIANERRALQLAVGAARERVVLSYPRLDLDLGRPRVPSFYALEALRAAEGVLPGFDELAARAEQVSESRIGWPAPQSSEEAIDEAEHDLALLERLLVLPEEQAVGTARFLLAANPHLGRALRFRARRWFHNWTPADGLLKTSDAAKAAIAQHALAARSYSATALQHYSSCPYRFFLSAVLRLSPREVPEAIDELNPLQRGSLVHDTQFELFRRLESEGLLPVTPDRLVPAREELDEVLDHVAQEYREKLAPAIERVWLDGIAAVRADLREWLRRMSEDTSGYVPWRFELAFGLGQGSLASRGRSDEHSTRDAAALECGIALRGSIDLVERRPAADGAPASLRITDHKTGKARVAKGSIVAGGEALQPVLYALAAEQVVSDAVVDSGRLYYCTSAGGFEERDVPLSEEARRSAQELATAIDAAIEEPFLPAAPKEGACRFCDYRIVCGPYEEMRTARKPRGQLLALDMLRGLR